MHDDTTTERHGEATCFACLTSSPGSEGSASALNGPGCEQPPSAKSTHTADGCSPDTGPRFPSTTTSVSSTAPGTPEQLTLFAEDFRAKTSVEPASKQDFPGQRVVFGTSTADLSGKFSRDGLSSRTLPHSCIEDWPNSSRTLPRSGTMRNGTVSQLSTWAPLRSGIESGLWPTLCSRGKPGGPVGLGGGSAAKRKLDRMVGVETRKQMCSSGLSPLWTEWLMGYPMGWTESKHSETQLSLKSPSLSVEPSSPTNTSSD